MRFFPLLALFIMLGLLSACQSNSGSHNEEEASENSQMGIPPEEKEIENEQKRPSTFPPLQDLADLENTKFIPVLESKINTRENSFYTAAMPIAWDTLEARIPDSILALESVVMQEVDNSTSYQTALGKGGYTTEVEIEENRIRVRVSYKKTLPFKEPFEKLRKPIFFKDKPVQGFGGRGYGAVRDNTSILYYNNDKDFAIKLSPRLPRQQIILMKTDFPATGTLKEILDERGAKVESLIEVSEATGAMKEDEEKPKPKRLVFDEPFLVMLRRPNEPYPYFALFVADTELVEVFEE